MFLNSKIITQFSCYKTSVCTLSHWCSILVIGAASIKLKMVYQTLLQFSKRSNRFLYQVSGQFKELHCKHTIPQHSLANQLYLSRMKNSKLALVLWVKLNLFKYLLTIQMQIKIHNSEGKRFS